MTQELKVAVKKEPEYAVLRTDGYVNNPGGEKIARECYKLGDRRQETEEGRQETEYRRQKSAVSTHVSARWGSITCRTRRRAGP